MAGTMRLAAKLVLATTALGTGGGGAYYYTTSGQLPQWLTGGEAAPVLIAEPPEVSQAALDAVASAWAEPASAKSDRYAESSQSARTAEETLANAERVAAAPADNQFDRYATSATLAGAATTARSPESTAAEFEYEGDETTPTPADIAESLADVATPDESAHESTGATAQSTPALARGQEPTDEDIALIDQLEPATSASRNADSAIEPQQLQESTEIRSAERAREAFRDGQPSTVPRSVPTASDRYSSASAAPAADSSAAPASASAAGASNVNPFAAPPASAASSSAAPAAIATAAAAGSQIGDPGEPRAFADSLPDESGNPLIGHPIGTAAPLPAAANDAARAGFGAAAPSQYGSDERPQAMQPIPSPFENTTQSGLSGDSASALQGTGKPGERALEGPQRPSLAIHKIAPPEIQVGKPAKFLVHIRNLGNQAAEDVVVRDDVPEGTRLVSTTPSAQSDGNSLVWQLGKLSVGEERTLEMQLMPTAEGEVGSVATVTYSTQASVKTRSTMPQLAIRMTAPNEVMIGNELRVKIELKNPGTGDATGVMLFENVPQNVRHAAGPALEFEVGTLRAGETRELELALTAEKAGKVVNVLSARADGNLQVQQQVEFEVIAPALSVAVNGPERRYLERPATYEVIVENPGTAPAHDVHLVTKLPKGLQFVRANNMGEYDPTTHAVYWSLAELPEGEKGAVELVAMPIETGPQTLAVEGRAQQGLTDQAQQQIIIEGLAAIMFEVRDLDDPIEVGGETGYEIRVVNQGTKAATNVKVAINLPPGMQLVSADGETRHTVQGGNVVFEPLPQLAPKADTLYRVKLQGLQPGDQRVTVEVNTDDLGQPIRREESTRVFGDE